MPKNDELRHDVQNVIASSDERSLFLFDLSTEKGIAFRDEIADNVKTDPNMGFINYWRATVPAKAYQGVFLEAYAQLCREYSAYNRDDFLSTLYPLCILTKLLKRMRFTFNIL